MSKQPCTRGGRLRFLVKNPAQLCCHLSIETTKKGFNSFLVDGYSKGQVVTEARSRNSLLRLQKTQNDALKKVQQKVAAKEISIDSG